MSIGSKIADARKEKNLTQEQLADMMSVTRQSISRWESDLSYPEMEKVVLLSELLGVNCDYLLNDSYDVQRSGAAGKSAVTRL
ncbi:MAG: helix-turn-helix transcriptional regulator, partial [Clostridiaceae bacterium]|nr:helix-turn-helix transcriptional regulator [Clostridiaceae bacterium]